MKNLKLAESYVKVSDMEKSVSFYEELLQVKSVVRYKDRWTTIIDGFGLYRPEFDEENDVQMTNIERQLKVGNSSIIVFHSLDIEKDYNKIKNMDINEISDIADINLMAHYKFFHFKDRDDNMIEVGQYFD